MDKCNFQVLFYTFEAFLLWKFLFGIIFRRSGLSVFLTWSLFCIFSKTKYGYHILSLSSSLTRFVLFWWRFLNLSLLSSHFLTKSTFVTINPLISSIVLISRMNSDIFTTKIPSSLTGAGAGNIRRFNLTWHTGLFWRC